MRHVNQGTSYPRTSGFNVLPGPGRLDSQALYSKGRLGARRKIPLKRITSNTVVLVCAIASLLVLFVLLELHIRGLTNHSRSHCQPLVDLKSQIEGNVARTAFGMNNCCLS
jgi:hypothetical protein